MNRVTQRIIGAAALVVFACSPALAAPPDYNANPVLAEFARTGAKVYFLGEKAGLNGWFITKDGEIQIGYTSADSQYIVVGALYDGSGNNITTEQIKILYTTNKEARAFFDSNTGKLSQQTASNTTPGTTPTPAIGTTPVPADPHMLPSATVSPGERLMQALQNAAGVDLGAAAAPKLYMVADPNCPHCQATWKALRAAVFGGRLQIRLVPVDAGGAESARAAAQFLHNPNPLEAWDKYISGDHGQLAGTPDDKLLADIRNNHALIDSWHIQQTPYMSYRGKDGRVKVMQGEPQSADSLIDDIAP